MAYLNTYPAQNSCTMSVGGLNTSSTYSEIYISCNGSNSSNLIYGGSGYSTSKSWTIYSLSSGTQYWASYRLKTQAGSTGNGGDYFTTTAPAPVTVGAVGWVSASNYSAGAISVSWGSATNATEYNCEVWHYATGAYITGQVAYNTYTTIYGLNQGVYYQVKVYGRRSGSSNGTPAYTYITTTDYSVGGVGTVTVRAGSSAGSLQALWSSATNAEGYRAELYNSSGVYTGNYSTGSYTSTTFYSLSENTYYQVKVYGYRSGYSNGTPSWGGGYTASYPPASLTGLTVTATNVSGGINMSWNSATNAQGYRWEIYQGNTTSASALVANSSTTSTSASYSGLSQYVYYTVKVYPYRSGYTNGGYQTAGITTKDLTAPTIGSISGDGNGRVYFTWSASDAHSGMRSTNRYYVEISNANGSTYGNGSYQNLTYKTFTTDANGNEFVQNAYYYVKVVAYDAQGNNTSRNVRVQYKKARPTNWAWHTAKTAGQNVNITASEWNSFCTKINVFRQYKDLANYNFTTVSSGQVITASIVNQARTAINAMSPPSAVPSAVSAGSTMTALFFNSLSISLNSIQ